MSRAVAALVLLLCSSCASSASTSAPRVSLRLERLDGAALNLASLRGRVVLLTVINTWADPALIEVPRLRTLANTRDARDLVIVCVALDDSDEMIKIFIQTFEVPYLVVRPSNLAEFVGSTGPFGLIGTIPTSILIDREGRIAGRMDGTWPEEILEKAIDRLVAADRPPP